MHILRTNNFIPMLWRYCCIRTTGKTYRKVLSIVVCNGTKTGNNPKIITRRMNKYIMEYLYNRKLPITEN